MGEPDLLLFFHAFLPADRSPTRIWTAHPGRRDAHSSETGTSVATDAAASVSDSSSYASSSVTSELESRTLIAEGAASSSSSYPLLPPGDGTVPMREKADLAALGAVVVVDVPRDDDDEMRREEKASTTTPEEGEEEDDAIARATAA